MCEAEKGKKITRKKPAFFYNLCNEDGFENTIVGCV